MKELTIIAKYPGKCKECGDYFEAGEEILWSRGAGCRHIVCPDTKDEIQLEEEMEDPGNRAERELAETEIAEGENLRQKANNTGASFALLYGGREAPSYDYKVPVDKIEGACDLCGSLGLCGCDEPERGNAYLDLMAAFESKGMEVFEIPANALPVTDELFMGLSGIYLKRDKLLCIAPTAEHSKLVKEVVK